MKPLTGRALSDAFELHRRLGDAGALVDRRKVARACQTARGRDALRRAVTRAVRPGPLGAVLRRRTAGATRSTPRSRAAAHGRARGRTRAPARPADPDDPAGPGGAAR